MDGSHQGHSYESTGLPAIRPNEIYTVYPAGLKPTRPNSIILLSNGHYPESGDRPWGPSHLLQDCSHQVVDSF